MSELINYESHYPKDRALRRSSIKARSSRALKGARTAHRFSRQEKGYHCFFQMPRSALRSVGSRRSCWNSRSSGVVTPVPRFTALGLNLLLGFHRSVCVFRVREHRIAVPMEPVALTQAYPHASLGWGALVDYALAVAVRAAD